MEKQTAPIAVFDSGLGGISVLRELIHQMPNENYIYFGDSANAPYGPRSTNEVETLTCQNAQMLFQMGCKALVVACNTATSVAIHRLREVYAGIPIIGIEPALKPAVRDFTHPNVLVMATEMTLKEEKFLNLMNSFSDEATIYRLPGPGIVESVERGVVEGSELDAYLQEIFMPFRNVLIHAVVLGCTHFPFVQKAILKNLAQPAVIYDGADGTARETKRRLSEANLCNPMQQQGSVTFLNSGGDSMIDISGKLFAI